MVVISLVIFLLAVYLFFKVLKKIDQIEVKKLSEEVEVQINGLIIEFNKTAARNITLLEENIKDIDKVIQKANKKIQQIDERLLKLDNDFFIRQAKLSKSSDTFPRASHVEYDVPAHKEAFDVPDLSSSKQDFIVPNLEPTMQPEVENDDVVMEAKESYTNFPAYKDKLESEVKLKEESFPQGNHLDKDTVEEILDPRTVKIRNNKKATYDDMLFAQIEKQEEILTDQNLNEVTKTEENKVEETVIPSTVKDVPIEPTDVKEEKPYVSESDEDSFSRREKLEALIQNGASDKEIIENGFSESEINFVRFFN